MADGATAGAGSAAGGAVASGSSSSGSSYAGSRWANSELASDSTDWYGEGAGGGPPFGGGHSGGWFTDSPRFPRARASLACEARRGTPVNSHRDDDIRCPDNPTTARSVCPGRGRAAQVRAVGIGRV